MRATLALIRFELERRWLAPVVGLASGMLSYLMPFVPGVFLGPPNELRGPAAGISATCYGVLLAVALGGSLHANDLAERRISFLFARPLSAATIAVGRFISALLVVTVSMFLALLPSLLAGARFEASTLAGRNIAPPLLAAGFLLLYAALLLVSALVAVAARARTAWLILEMSALVFGGLCLEFLRLRAGSVSLALAVGAALAVAAFVAYPISLAVGRTDLARAHRAQAIVTATVLGAIGVAALGWRAG